MSDLHGSFALATDVVVQVIGDEALVLNLHNEVVFTLNATGTRVAQLLIDGVELHAVASRLAEEYGASVDVIALDVQILARSLIDRGLLVARSGGTTA